MATVSTKPGYQEFTAVRLDKSKVKLSVRLPQQKELQYADIEQSVAFNRAQEAGLPVRARLLRKLKATDSWTDKDQAESDALRVKLLDAQNKFTAALTFKDSITSGVSPSDTAIAAATEAFVAATDELTDARKLYQERVNEFSSMTEHTADQKAEIAYRNYLISCVIERVGDSKDGKNGSRLFGSLEDFLNCNDPDLIGRLLYEFQACQNGMASEWTAADKVTEAEEAAAAAKVKADADAKAAADKAATAKETPITPENKDAPAGDVIKLSFTSEDANVPGDPTLPG